MFDLNTIRTAVERDEKAVVLRPSLARGTDVASAAVREDLRCDIDAEGWKLSFDVGDFFGGGLEPKPGQLALSALLTCLAIGCVIQFSKRGLSVAGLRIDIEADYDANESAEYSELRYLVHVESDAPEEEILAALDDNDAHSFGLALFQRPIATRREVRVTSPSAPEAR